MSVNIVNQTTGALTQVAGNATDKVGNLDALTTTDKSSCIAAINELDAYTKRVYGSYIDISSYDSSNNLYTVPADGMVVLAVNEINTNAKIALIDYDLNAALGESMGNGSTQARANVVLIKGQRIYFLKTNAVGSMAYFFPKVNPS